MKIISLLFLIVPIASQAQNWLFADKANDNEEAGIQFRKAGVVQFYLYSDNYNNGLKIQSTQVSGEGDNTPRFHLPISSPDLYMVESGGNVGIGTTSPQEKLHINGSIRGGGYANTLRISTGSGYVDVGPMNTSWSHFQTDRPRFYFNKSVTVDGGISSYASNNLYLQTTEVDRLTILSSNGFVGIGTTSPDQRLTVNGNIHAKEVKVDLSVPGPDYVFEPNYRLTSLEELKQYIDQHKHLPEIPSAKEMETNGINLMEMNVLLLKKLEEMTLHMIEMKEQLRDQQKQIEALKKN